MTKFTPAELKRAAEIDQALIDAFNGNGWTDNAPLFELWEEPPLRPRKRRKPRKPTLTAALRQALKAGKPVRGAEFTADGGVKLTFGEPEAAEQTNPNPWLAELDKAPRQ
jgi:hypothetical protein